MGEARISRGHPVKLLDELGILHADRRLIARCAGSVDERGNPSVERCPCFIHIRGIAEGKEHFCSFLLGQDVTIDVNDVPPLECPFRKAAVVLALDPVAK